MKEENHNYSAEDFARYHSGRMPADEMHALEKHALNDPFLADALEGYRWSEDYKKELQALYGRLPKAGQSSSSRNTYPFSAKWWMVAAVTILLAGGGYLYFFTNTGENKPLTIAQEGHNIPASATEILTDTSVAGKKDVQIPREAVQPTPKGRTPVSVAKKPLERKPSLALRDAAASEKLTQRSAGLSEDSNVIANHDPLITTGVSPSPLSEKKQMANAAFRPAAPESSAIDSVQLFLQPKEQTSLLAASARATKAKNLSVHETNQSRKKKTVAGLIPVSPGLLPLGGKAAFEQYILDSARICATAQKARQEIIVMLSFILDDQEKPTQINVLRSNNHACDREAIRLLLNGPRWNGKPGDRGKVTISF